MTEVDQRPPNTKYLAITPDQVNGASRIELFEQSEDFKEARSLHNHCMLYASAYNEIMLLRLEKEQPDFYEENNINKKELVAHLTNNMCLPYTKYKHYIFRNTAT
jgi:hypothetical protein